MFPLPHMLLFFLIFTYVLPNSSVSHLIQACTFFLYFFSVSLSLSCSFSFTVLSFLLFTLCPFKFFSFLFISFSFSICSYSSSPTSFALTRVAIFLFIFFSEVPPRWRVCVESVGECIITFIFFRFPRAGKTWQACCYKNVNRYKNIYIPDLTSLS